MNDTLGNLIVTGSQIAYAVATREGVALKVATVEDIDENSVSILTPDGKTVHLKNFDRMVVLARPEVVVEKQAKASEHPMAGTIADIVAVRNHWAILASACDVHVEERLAAPRVVLVLDAIIKALEVVR